MIKLVGKIWWCDFRTPEGERIRRSLGNKDKREAKDLEVKLLSDTEERSRNRNKGGITIREAYKHALRYRDNWRSAKDLPSIERVYGYVESHFTPDRTLASLDEETVVEYGEELANAGLRPSTINKRLSMIHILFDEARKARKFTGQIPQFDRYKIRDSRRMRTISRDEEATIRKLLIAHGTEASLALADLIVVLVDTGARLSEGLGISPSSIFWDDMAVLLRKTKNGSERVVPLTTRAAEVLRKRIGRTPMFTPLDRDSADYHWALMRERMGLKHDTEFVIHALRHTFGSTMANSGMDAFRIKELMGHNSIQSTEIYVKVSTASLKVAAKIMENRTMDYDLKPTQRGNKTDPKGTLGDLLKVEISGTYVIPGTPLMPLKSLGLNRPCRFDSGSGHHVFSSYSYTYTHDNKTKPKDSK